MSEAFFESHGVVLLLRDQQGEDDCRTLQESALAKNSLFLQIFLVDQPFWLDTDHFWVFDFFFSFFSFLWFYFTGL